MFPEPQAKLTEVPLIRGLDGHQKMSKSIDNHLDLAATELETSKRVLTAFTDPERLRRSDPGRPDICNVYSLHKMFSEEEEVKSVYDECTKAERGCVDCKKHLGVSLNKFLEPIRDRRTEFEKRPGLVKDILEDGCKSARSIAQNTIEEVYQRMGLA